MKIRTEKQNKILKRKTKKIKWNKSGSPPRKVMFSSTVTFLLFMGKEVLSKCMHDALFIAAVSNGSQKLVWKQHEEFKTLIF